MQTRKKWQGTRRNLRAGDVVLVREEGAYRKDWPIGRGSKAMESDDGRVRKAQVEIVRGSTKKTFLRPIKELVLLVGEVVSQTQTLPLAREEDNKTRARIRDPWARSVTLSAEKGHFNDNRRFRRPWCRPTDVTTQRTNQSISTESTRKCEQTQTQPNSKKKVMIAGDSVLKHLHY